MVVDLRELVYLFYMSVAEDCTHAIIWLFISALAGSPVNTMPVFGGADDFFDSHVLHS